VGGNPIAERPRPGRLDDVGEGRGTHRRDEHLRRARLAGQSVDLTGTVSGLAYRVREIAFPDPVQLAEAGAAESIQIAGAEFVPQDRQRDVLALELAIDPRPVEFVCRRRPSPVRASWKRNALRARPRSRPPATAISARRP
jgi:hypothetical protein